MRRGRTVFVLAAVAVLLAVAVWLDARRPSTDEQRHERARLLPGFDRAAATTIEIERAGAVTRLRHEASGWWLAELHRRADDGNVEALLGALEYGELERRVAPVDAALWHTLGLDRPRVVVRVAGHTLAVGNDDPARGVYVRRDGEPAALVAEHRLVETADLDPRLWRSLRLTLVEPADAARLAAGPWALERRAGWRVTAPVQTRAADAKVGALVQALTRARATRELARPVEQGSAVTLSVDGAEQARIGGACPDAPKETVVARADGAWLCFAAAALDLVRAPPATYYERRLFPLRLDDVVAADVGPLQLRRESAAWRVIAPPAAVGPARDEAVRAWLEPLLAADAASFAATPVAGGTRVRIATRDDAVAATVDGARARRDGDTVTLELSSAPPLSSDAARLRAADLGASPF